MKQKNTPSQKPSLFFVNKGKDALFSKKYAQVGSAKLHGFEVLLTTNEIHVRFCLTLFPKSR